MAKRTIAIILLIVILFSIAYLYTGETEETIDSNKPHFQKSNITYSLRINSSLSYENGTLIGRANDTAKREKIELALELIENASNNSINFKEVPDGEDEDIDIVGLNAYNDYCDNYLLEYTNESYYTNGWGEIKEYNPNTNEIYYSEVTFCSKHIYNYTTGEEYSTWQLQEYPETEVHEILHAIGFDHINETCSIMNPYSQIEECENVSISEDISYCLQNIYSNEKVAYCPNINFMF